MKFTINICLCIAIGYLARRANARNNPCEVQHRPILLTPRQSVECGWSASNEDLLANRARNAVRERELEVLSEKLLNIWALDVVGLLELNNLEDLGNC